MLIYKVRPAFGNTFNLHSCDRCDIFLIYRVSAGRMDSRFSPKVLEIKKYKKYGLAWFAGANLLAETNFFIDYYFKRYDYQVRFFKWNNFFEEVT